MARRLQPGEGVNDSPLDPAELEAIQAAIREASPAVPLGASNIEAVPLPLIAADREAQAARPRLAELASRWARQLPRALRAFIGDVVVDSMGSEVVDATALLDELRAMWTAVVSPGERGALVCGIGGELIVAAAARRCGDAAATAGGREPSTLTLGMFGPVGDAAIAALTQAWSEVDRTPLARGPSTPADLARALGNETVLAATLVVSGAANGRIRLFVRPGMLASAATSTTTVPADPAAVAIALGGVPVELRVELGTLEMSLTELRALGPGAQLELPVFVDDALPIYCGDVLKAWGRPFVSRGVLAVEVTAVAAPGGVRP